MFSISLRRADVCCGQSLRFSMPPALANRIVGMASSSDRQYKAWAQAINNQPAGLVNFVGRAAERSLHLYLETCTPVSAASSPEAE